MNEIALLRLRQRKPHIGAEGKQSLRGRKAALIGILLVAFSARQAVSAVSPLLPAIGDDLPFSAVSAGVLGMLPTAGFALMGFLAVPLIRRIELEHLLLVSIVLVTLGQVGRALGWTIPLFLLLTGIAMLGLGLVNVVMPPLLMKYFSDKAGVLAALHVTLLGVSTALAAQLAIPLAGLSGWRFSIGVWAGVSAVAAIPWMVLLARRRRVTRIKCPPPSIQSSPRTPRIKPWKSSIGWGAALVFAGCSSNTFAAVTWLPTVLVDRGLSQEAGGSMLALYSIIGLPTGLIVPLIVVSMQRPLPLAVLFAVLFAAGYGGIMFAPPASAAIWVIVAGLGQGAYSFAFTMINKRARTPGGSGALSGFAQGVGYTLACLGPLLFGLLHRAGDNWLPSFGMLGVWLLVLITGAMLINKPRVLEDTLQRPNTESQLGGPAAASGAAGRNESPSTPGEPFPD
ncbi:MFS transporter [Arthrobacter sp. Z1-9]